MTYFALVLAAGGGTRMAADCPKQYLPLAGRPVLWHTLSALASVAAIEKVFIVLAAADDHWDRHDWSTFSGRLAVFRCGGATRAESVTNGLRAMRDLATPDDWVLVHDAARCCLTMAHVDTLIAEVGNDRVGGLLAVPVADTLKRGHQTIADGVRIVSTVDRDELWQAQTPQMFRHGLLAEALEYAPRVTDEASAIESLGLHPRLVAADATNLKVTYPLDLQLAEWILQNREA
jgi:2-C-methyl-D-erythritol 4-phosphate cytidylyltransferase